ncbi:MAG: hypothetical protein ACTSRG_08240 [Candidatus Helarchaeota archaeon]
MNFEIEYNYLWINILIYCTAIPIQLITPITFFIFTKRTRGENRGVSNRSLWLGLGTLCYAIGYTIEIARFFLTTLSNPFRSFLTVATIILYIYFTIPEWFRNKIGWQD